MFPFWTKISVYKLLNIKRRRSTSRDFNNYCLSSDHLEIGPELILWTTPLITSMITITITGPELNSHGQWRIQEFRKGGPKGELRCKNGHEIKSAERRRRVSSYD